MGGKVSPELSIMKRSLSNTEHALRRVCILTHASHSSNTWKQGQTCVSACHGINLRPVTV